MKLYGFMRLGRRFGVGVSTRRSSKNSGAQIGAAISVGFWIFMILLVLILIAIF